MDKSENNQEIFSNIDDQHLQILDEICAIPAARDIAGQSVRDAKVGELLGITTAQVVIARDMILRAMKRTPKRLVPGEMLFFLKISFLPVGINYTDLQMLENSLFPVFVGCPYGAQRIK